MATEATIPHCWHCGEEIDVVGAKHAAETLNVSISQFQNLKAREDFPEPWGDGFSQGALWRRQDLIEWQEARKRVSVDKLVSSFNLERLSKREQDEFLKLAEKLAAAK